MSVEVYICPIVLDSRGRRIPSIKAAAAFQEEGASIDCEEIDGDLAICVVEATDHTSILAMPGVEVVR